MRLHLITGLTLALLIVSGQAQDSASASANAIATRDDEAYAALLKINLETDTQIKLLRSLAQVHRNRSEEASKANQAEKARWESDLAKELSDQADALVKRLNLLVNRPAAEGSADTKAAAATPDSEFIKRLDERYDRTSRDLLAARTEAAANSAQMYTNKTSADFEKASNILEQNARKVRELERELSDLELRKLEFNALRRP